MEFFLLYENNNALKFAIQISRNNKDDKLLQKIPKFDNIEE